MIHPGSLFRRVAIILGVVTSIHAGCGSDDNSDKVDAAMQDASLDQLAQAKPEAMPIDDPFGRACSELGKPCKDKDPQGYDLLCVGVAGGAEGKGFCTRTCTDVGNECFGAPNAQWAACLLGGENSGKFCLYLCQDKKQGWPCPPTLHCDKPSAEGVAICIP
jgi:hypothetical protein